MVWNYIIYVPPNLLTGSQVMSNAIFSRTVMPPSTASKSQKSRALVHCASMEQSSQGSATRYSSPGSESSPPHADLQEPCSTAKMPMVGSSTGSDMVSHLVNILHHLKAGGSISEWQWSGLLEQCGKCNEYLLSTFFKTHIQACDGSIIL